MARLRVAMLLVCVAMVATATAMPVPLGAQPGATHRIVVVPDTQNYATSTSGAVIVQEQYQWIADQADASNTIFVTALGDVVQNPNSTTEWNRVEPGFVALEQAEIPYGIAPGNHDLEDGGGPVEFDERFGADRFAAQPWFGGSHESEGNRSSYQYVSMPGHDVLFVHVRHLVADYGAVDPVLSWLDGLLAAHPDHLVFVTTHEFTDGNGSIRIPALRDVLDDHCNVAAVFSGHRPGEAARGTFDDTCGRSVHHVLTNYQFIDNGGDGFLRTIDIDPLTLIADFAVYSPTLDRTRTGTDETFTAQLAKLDPVDGDVNCDRSSDIVDALVLAQYLVLNRTDHGACPLAVGATQIDSRRGDRNADDSLNIVDALLIAQCAAQLQNVSCPAGG